MMFALSLNMSLMCAIEDSNFSIVILPAPPELKQFTEKDVIIIKDGTFSLKILRRCVLKFPTFISI